MPEPLRICLFDAAGETDTSFHDPFTKLEQLQIVGTATTWDEVRAELQQSNLDVVAVNLDQGGDEGIRIVERIAQSAPGCGIIGVSASTDASVIINAMRAGCSQFVTAPIDAEDLLNAVRRLKKVTHAPQAKARRVCVIGSSGGAGATTITCNLAIELAGLVNRTCAVVDMNLEFGDLGCAFDCTPKYTVADICRDGVDVDPHMLREAAEKLPCGVALLARPENLEDARLVSPEGIEAMMGILPSLFPFTVVDLPRTFSFISAAAVQSADHVLIVTQLNVASIRNATRIYRCLVQMGAIEDSVKIVLNRCKANFERITPVEVESHFGRPIYGMVPNDFKHVQMSLDLGNPASAEAPNSPSRVAIREIARRLAREHIGEDEKGKPDQSESGGFLGIFKRSAKTAN